MRVSFHTETSLAQLGLGAAVTSFGLVVSSLLAVLSSIFSLRQALLSRSCSRLISSQHSDNKPTVVQAAQRKGLGLSLFSEFGSLWPERMDTMLCLTSPRWYQRLGCSHPPRDTCTGNGSLKEYLDSVARREWMLGRSNHTCHFLLMCIFLDWYLINQTGGRAWCLGLLWVGLPGYLLVNI